MASGRLRPPEDATSPPTIGSTISKPAVTQSLAIPQFHRRDLRLRCPTPSRPTMGSEISAGPERQRLGTGYLTVAPTPEGVVHRRTILHGSSPNDSHAEFGAFGDRVGTDGLVRKEVSSLHEY